MIPLILRFTSLLVAFFITASTLQAATLVGYQLSGFSGTDSLSTPTYPLPTDSADIPGSFTDANLETVSLSVGSALDGTNQAGFYRFSITGPVGTNSSTISDAFVEFTIDPAAGQQFSLDATNSLQFFSRLYDVDDYSAGLFVRSSLDGYTTTLDTWNHPGGTDAQTASFDLAGFTDIDQAVTFRVYVFDSDGTGNGLAIRDGGSLGLSGDLDFVVNGSVAAVPEPSAFGLSALGCGLLLLLRRRRHC